MKIIKMDEIFDHYHGTTIADPFRWLEDSDSEATNQFITDQLGDTRRYLDTHENRAPIKARITELWNYEKFGVPKKQGDYFYYLYNDGMKNQPVLYRSQTLDDHPTAGQLVFDVNVLDRAGKKALTEFSISPDGQYMAYGISESGSDWQTIYIRDLMSGLNLKESITWCKFTMLPWLADSSGFMYNSYPDPATVPAEDTGCYSRVYLHRLHTESSEDQLLIEDQEDKKKTFRIQEVTDNDYLIVNVSKGSASGNEVWLKEINGNSCFTPLITVPQTLSMYLGNNDHIFYFLTNIDAPRRRVVAIDINQPAQDEWQTIIPEGMDVITQALMTKGHFVTADLHDAYHQLLIYSHSGQLMKRLELPTMGAISTLSGKADRDEFYFDFASYLYPNTVFRGDTRELKSTVLWRPHLDFDFEQYQTTQVFYESKDGTRIPMFISCRKDLVLNSDNPTFLYSYGGFNIARIPEFKAPDLVWMERGGIFAVANLRGGSEYGEEWHQAGMLENKQNVYDDFIAAAEYLIEQKYTRRERLAIKGRSNGGLLTAACMLQRPDLYGAVISQVPVIDMFRYHKFTVGRFWVPEYGDAESNAEHFAFMYKYSPLHNVRFGTVYPPIMIMTAKTDDRVVPMHSLKFAATLQTVNVGHNPILLRIEFGAGHGGGKPTSLLIDEQADVYTFLDKNICS